jgi:Spy/CpxP family protein refolding chaperone
MNKKTTAATRTGLVLALFFFPLLASAQRLEENRARQARPRARTTVRDFLDLTTEQEAKIEAFHKARAADRKAARDEMIKLRDERRELEKDPEANEAEIGALIDHTFKIRAEQAKKALRSRAEWKEIFTPEQWEQMRTSRAALSARARRAAPARFRIARPGMGRRMAPRLRGFARIGPRGRYGAAFRTPGRWRRF